MIPHVCAAKIGARGCQQPRVPGKLFCPQHLTSGSRFELPARIYLSEDFIAQHSVSEIEKFIRERSRR